jgi:hypothetical protein
MRQSTTAAYSSIVAIALLVSACGEPGGRTEARQTAGALKGGDAAVATSPQCKLFTPAEVSKFIGEPVAAGVDAALGCQWVATDDSGDVIVAVVPAQYHEPPKGSTGFKQVNDVGSGGFVAPYMDGWIAGAIVGKEALRVSVAGATADEASAVSLLKEAIRRHAS